MPGQIPLDHFSALEDPWQSRKGIDPLPEVLLAAPCGAMAGAGGFAEIER